jgi:hypothetical protein
MKRAMNGYSIPPRRELPAARLAARKRHLIAEIEAGLPRAFPLRAGLAAAAFAAAAVAVLLVAPWGRGPTLTDRALAAVGEDPVLHVVTKHQAPAGFYDLVSVATGKPLPVTLSDEVWFDPEHKLEKTVSTVNGVVTDEVLESAEGWFSQDGPVYTCAWIAAHPIEATKARVSCNEDMDNGTTPHQIPESPPTPLDPAITGFVDHYQSALASGQAEQTGTGELDGSQVIWLRIPIGDKGNAHEDVAIDAGSYSPLLIRTTRPDGSQDELRVSSIETLPYDEALFAKPEVVPPRPSIANITDPTPIDLEQAGALLDGQALWLGRSWNGFELAQVTRDDLVTGYGALSGRDPSHSTGVVFEYRGPDGKDFDLRETAQCEFAYGWMCGRFPLPDPGTALMRQPIGTFVRQNGLYVSIYEPAAWNGAARVDALEVARALTAVPSAS